MDVAVWAHLSQLGDSRWLLPLSLILLLAGPSGSARLRCRWAIGLSIAAALTLTSKLAYLGWGLGWPRLDFTGFSGHATISAAIYPVVFLLATHGRRRAPLAWAAAGAALAAAIAYSRLPLHAHSVSEVVSGWAIGCAASAYALSARPANFTTPIHTLVLAACIGLLVPVLMPSLRTHDVVTRLATSLSGRDSVYGRQHLSR